MENGLVSPLTTTKRLHWVGIDLGARNCRVAIVTTDGQVRLVPNYSREDMATKAYITIPMNSSAERLVGRGITNTRPERIIFDACVDHNFGQAPLSDSTTYHRFAQYNRDTGGYWVDEEVGWISQLDALTLILSHLRDMAVEEITQGENYTGQLNAVIAIPTYSGQNYRCLVAQAARQADFDTIRIINQSTCALLAYRRDSLRGRLPSPSGPDDLLALLCIGARCVEASVFSVRASSSALIWSQGTAALGGDDFTAALTAHIIRSSGPAGEQISAWDFKELRKECEAAAARLSSQRKTQIDLPSHLRTDYTTATGHVAITSELFWDICEPVYQGVESLVAAAFSPYKDRISHVTTAGAASLLPHLKERVVAKHVRDGCKFISTSCLVPKEAVAVGAALKASLFDTGADSPVDSRADVSDYAYSPVHLLSNNGSAICVVQPCEQIPTLNAKVPSFLTEEHYRVIQSRDANGGVCGELRLTASSWVSICVSELGQLVPYGENCQLVWTNSSNLRSEIESLHHAAEDRQIQQGGENGGSSLPPQQQPMHTDISRSEPEDMATVSKAVGTLPSHVYSSPVRQKRSLFTNGKSPIRGGAAQSLNDVENGITQCSITEIVTQAEPCEEGPMKFDDGISPAPVARTATNGKMSAMKKANEGVKNTPHASHASKAVRAPVGKAPPGLLVRTAGRVKSYFVSTEAKAGDSSGSSSNSVPSDTEIVRIEEAENHAPSTAKTTARGSASRASSLSSVASQRPTLASKASSIIRSKISTQHSTTMSGTEAKLALEPLKNELRELYPNAHTSAIQHTPVYYSLMEFYKLSRAVFGKNQVSLAEFEAVVEEARRLLLLGRALQLMDSIIGAMQPHGTVTKNDAKFIADAEIWRARLITFDRTTRLNNDSRRVIAARLREFTRKVGVLVKGHWRMSKDAQLNELLDLSDLKLD